MSLEQEIHWFSINLDDTVSHVKSSFKEACNKKSLYIVERIYYSQSYSGKTIYYKYKFYTKTGKVTNPRIGDCVLLAKTHQGYREFSQQKESIVSNRNEMNYPLSRWATSGTYNKCSICDNEGELKVIYLNDIADLIPFLRKLSSNSNWQEFQFVEYLKALIDETNTLKVSVTNFGYSKREYTLETGTNPINQKQYFKDELEKILKAVDKLIDKTDSNYLEDKFYTINYLKEDLDYISETLKGLKPWRKHLS